jgi:hypothetical protein
MDYETLEKANELSDAIRYRKRDIVSLKKVRDTIDKALDKEDELNVMNRLRNKTATANVESCMTFLAYLIPKKDLLQILDQFIDEELALLKADQDTLAAL